MLTLCFNYTDPRNGDNGAEDDRRLRFQYPQRGLG